MYVVWLFCHVCVHDTFFYFFFFFKLKTAYEMRISDWSADVCSSDLSCRPDQIHLRQPMLAHFRRVVGITEEVEDQLELVWRLRQDMPHSQHILDLHDDKLRKDALQMVGNEFIELLPVFDDCRIFKRELVLVGRDVLVIRRPGRVRGNEEITARMQIVVLTDDPRLLVRPDKIERRVKGVEERRMIAVANILHIELPVARS